MKNRYYLLISAFVLIFLSYNKEAAAQCTWQPAVTDGFEYTTVIPDLIPGTTVHTTPQTFAAHSGTRSMYMNFINCSGGTGTCAGAKVYERTFPVCAGLPLRFNIWMTTTFSGTQCDMKIVISDANGNGLDSTVSLLAPYNPSWIQYISDTILPTTSTIIFTMYTNVDGGNGNDLSVDDFKLERCVKLSSLTGYNVCNNLPTVDLFNAIPASPGANGTWAGPGSLSGGYLGTFTPGTSTGGTYIYTNYPYGTGANCPTRTDTVVAVPFPAPVINLINDTVICTNQTVTLVAGTGAGNLYSWNTGATTSSIVAATSGSVNTSATYTVLVTNVGGCTATDSVTVNFVVCSGLDAAPDEMMVSVFPNPAYETITVTSGELVDGRLEFIITDMGGRTVFKDRLTSRSQQYTLPKLEYGSYQYMVTDGLSVKGIGKLLISK